MRPATCWEIRPTRSQTADIYRLTDHPHELTLGVDQQTYRPQAFDASAVRGEVGFKEGDREVVGVISSDDLTDELLRSGVLLGARITEYLVDWLMPYLPPVETLRYDVVDMEFNGDVWNVQVGNLMTVLSEPIGEYYGPRCGVEVFSLGAGQCNADNTDFVAFRDVTSVTSDAPFTQFVVQQDLDLSVIPSNEKWRDGKCVWVTGANQGHVSYIRSVDLVDDRTVTLHLPTPNPIEVDDQCSLSMGCNKLSGAGNTDGDCRNLYDNLANFQGDPFMPTRDETTRGIPTP